MIGTIVYVTGSRKLKKKKKKKSRDEHPFKTDTIGRHCSALMFLPTGQLTEVGRPNTHGR